MRPEWIEVGRIARAHGVHGELRIVPSSDNPDRFVPGAVLFGRPERPGLAGPRVRERTPLTVDSVRGDDTFPIVAFVEVPDRETAEGLRGYLLEVSSDELPALEEDEFYPFDLGGLEVRDVGGVRRGRVADAVETPAHALLVVVLDPPAVSDRADATTEPGVEELLVPFVHEAVPSVSVEGGYLVIADRFLERS